jgi:hypothetical protein
VSIPSRELPRIESRELWKRAVRSLLKDDRPGRSFERQRGSLLQAHTDWLDTVERELTGDPDGTTP